MQTLALACVNVSKLNGIHQIGKEKEIFNPMVIAIIGVALKEFARLQKRLKFMEKIVEDAEVSIIPK